MAEVHQLILQIGIEKARQQAATKHERALVEAAYEVLSEDAEKIGFSYSGFALTSLPHRDPQGATTWRRDGHNLTMVLQAGVDQNQRLVGLPFGSYARFILLFLQTEAIRTGSREVETGPSLHAWLVSMGISVGGRTFRLVSEQSRRLSACTMMFYTTQGEREMMRRGGFLDGAITMADTVGGETVRWHERVLLNEQFYQALRDHPVPLNESALRAIGPRSMAIDVYVWLAYRLHALKRSAEISWPSLHEQFGAGFARLRDFRANFLESLALAVAAYPEAHVDEGDRGVVLHPSRPAVMKRL